MGIEVGNHNSVNSIHKEEIMVNFITNVMAWFVKNVGLIVGILEAIVKVFAGIASLTPTRKDDALANLVSDKFDTIKAVIYKIADFFANAGK